MARKNMLFRIRHCELVAVESGYAVRGSFENPGSSSSVFVIAVTVLKQTVVCTSGDGTRPHEREKRSEKRV